ncbi:MAG: adenine deaminase [Deltaproteobacteria bacterium]|nr:MAG: adenine deaminase [Deltaproteobacteria bacterium]
MEEKHQLDETRKDWADIFLTGGTVLNVYSGELLETNVAITGERFSYVGDSSDLVGRDTKVIDMSNKFLVPGYIDPHFHPWFVYNPISFAQEACPLGITTLFCDNLLFYMLMGVERFEGFMHAFSQMPIKFFWFCRAVPQTPMVEEDALFSLENLKRLLGSPYVQSLGEITRWPQVIKGDEKISEMIKFTKTLKKRVDGHTAGAKYDQVGLLSRAGIESCHEAITAQEVLDRLRLGMYVILRESSLRQDLKDLLRVVTENKVLTDRLMLTTDCSAPAFYQDFGITDHILKIAIEMGIDPVLVYRMVTINPAVYFGMDHEIGGIAPGRFADLVVLNDLRNPAPEILISKGQIIAQDGRLLEPFPNVDWEYFLPPASFSKNNWKAKEGLFGIRSDKEDIRFPVINLIKPVITRLEWEKFQVKNGLVDLGNGQEHCFITLIHRDGQWVRNGIIKGFGNVDGFASSFNTAAQILVIGRDRTAMAAAVNRVLEIRGGVVGVEKDRIAYELPLPIGGIMSDKPMNELAEKERELKAFLAARGYPFHDPFYTLVFLPNDFLPEVRINYRGIVNIKTNEVLWPW